MKNHRYILEPYKGISTRYNCPGCKQREFTRYIDTTTGQHINSKVGLCNRVNSCGYHYTPSQYFHDNDISFDALPAAHLHPKPAPHPKKPSFIPVEIFKQSLTNHDKNHFIKYLLNLFGVEITQQLIATYYIGTADNGRVIFWQIDTRGKIRTGKVMQYDPDTGKRDKTPNKHPGWVHNMIGQDKYELRQCLFGEHLLRDKTKTVGIVESEKTAIIASVYMPKLIWVATGSLNNLNVSKCATLAGRKVILYPDLGATEKWSAKAKEIASFTELKVSSLIERHATEEERQQGLDVADFLIRYDYHDFGKRKPEQVINTPAPDMTKPVEVLNTEWAGKWLKEDKPQCSNWRQEIAELEKFFATTPLPTTPVRISPEAVITDISTFLDSHLSIVKAKNGNKRYQPYLDRLRELKRVLTINPN